jgi:Fic family protein
MWSLKKLPPEVDLETKKILRKCSQANRYLAELKGISSTIPNQNILINTLSIQEAKDSSEVENIVTTHYQFESIHPFYDGNGRTGRILNILYLVQKKLLDIPVLYLSRYIIEHKNDYYRLLQEIRDHDRWEEWILYILDGIEKTSIETIAVIRDIHHLMLDYKRRIRANYKFYSQDLLNNLFCHPYTKIDFIQRDLGVTRKTAAKYLDDLVLGGFLQKEKYGVHHYFVNRPLFEIFAKRRVCE